eukprot:3401620-Amphidinium_carterae.1
MEEWSLSICLFHAIFGGNLSKHQLINGRPGELTKNGVGYNTSWVEDVVSNLSTRLYDFAQKRFAFDLQRYGVSVDSCGKRTAGLH